MIKPRPVLVTACLLLLCFTVFAQDTSRPRRNRGGFQRDSAFNTGDSSRRFRDSSGRFSDSPRFRGGISSLFADSAKLTSSDYQLQIEKTYVTLNNIDNKSDQDALFTDIKQNLADKDSMLAVLKDNVLNNTHALNLRNLQVFRTLLVNIQRDLRDQSQLLDSTEKKLSALTGSMRSLITDTVLRQLMRDSALRQQFASQLKDMRESWRTSTRHLRQSIATVNLLQTHTSSNAITNTKLLEKVNTLINTSSSRVFGKEYNYLWERDTIVLSESARSSFQKAYDGERKALQYYFKDSGNKRLVLLLVGLLFFIWTFRNIRILKKRNALNRLDGPDFDYLPSAYIVSSFVVMFCIGPLFDLHAPSAYIESMQFLLLIILTIICWKKWPRNLFANWIVMAILYICFSFSHHIADPGFWQRSWFILLNVLSVVFGLSFLSRMKDHLHLKGFLRFVIILHNVMNVLSILFNLAGRLTIAQILGNAAIFSFMQAIGLAVFSKICLEAILMQIITSRVKRGNEKRFEYQNVLTSFGKPILFLVVLLWLIVFATNLSIYTYLLDGITGFLQAERFVGNASFTIGGILLFFLIIWIAHLLQKYVGYFFGDTGADDEVQNKGARSRLLIARLIVLCLGYLLAVAASGVPVDRITIVLGALGVGIGLGLQNIVNNFVSGIILIFDRPLQIGDIVEISDKTGKVREIGLRSSTIMTDAGAEVIIPNGDLLSQQITNWTLSNSQQRLEMDLTITGSTDMEKVAGSIKTAIQSSKNVFEGKEPQILFTKLNENGFDLKAFYWCRDVAHSEQVKSEVLLLVSERLKEEGVGMC
jgi:potassium efflux system protein